ncbi:ABC transporter ATP-binding protein [Shewanella cyperi]|uniref:ABC transporter ATP-binding protein n=1 Tax=Shewanella cyperi TaxID=2814292 RepID=A0A974XL87_9GAMM|nr:ABC transporter ATP-binding protein [Shewanella cyperi]QSX30472.1 ABC transporter ATP-binding protein [Shewanella cyperi]
MSKAIVSLTGIGKRYGTLQALSGIGLQLAPGEVLGLFGHNGAGKTTMMKIILGVLAPSEGEVRVFDVDPQSKQAWQGRRQIGYLPENVSFYDQLSGRQVLSYFARLKGVAKTEVLRLLQQVGLEKAMDRQVKTYSKGMRQRLGLAQAFLGDPKLLLLDEPTVGLDPLATAEFYQAVDKLKQDGASIILCSHVLPGVEQHIDRAMILSGGRALALGTLEELRRQASLPVAIRTKGLNGTLGKDSRFQPYMVDSNRLLVTEEQKLATVRALLEFEALEDLQLEPADLGQLYQHYLGATAREAL